MAEKNAKVKLQLRTKSIAEKIAMGNEVKQALDGNPDFPGASTLITELLSATSELLTSKTDADAIDEKSKSLTKIQTQKEGSFDRVMNKIGNHVDDVSQGDPAKIASAGLEHFFPGDAPDIGKLQRPESLSAAEGDKEGEIDLNWDSVRGAKSYEIAISPQNPNNWTHAATAVPSKHTIKGLDSGKRYWFRVAAIGAAGRGPWSDPAIKIAP